MLVVTRRLLAAVTVVAVSSLIFASFAPAQTSGGLSGSETGTGTTAQPQAVEPEAGEAAPAEPGATPPAVETQTTTSTTTTTPATGGGIVLEGTTVTAGGAPGAAGSGDDGGVSWLTIAAVALAAIIAFVIVVLVLWRWRGWDPRWLRRWRHATAEAGSRLSLGWAEFRDFVRIGR